MNRGAISSASADGRCRVEKLLNAFLSVSPYIKREVARRGG